MALFATHAGFTPALLTWLLAYELQSTILLGAWLLLLNNKRRSAVRSREMGLRFALVAGIVTSLLTAAPWRGGLIAAPVTTAAAVPSGGAGVATRSLRIAERSEVHKQERRRFTIIPMTSAVRSWAALIVGTIEAIAIARLLLLGLSWMRFRWLIRRRGALLDPAWLEALEAGCRAHGLRRERITLTRTSSMQSPFALGMREICIPQWMVTSLSPASRRAVMDHELAHIARRDSAWQALVCVVEAVLWTQPLNGVARRELQELAEYGCDDCARREDGAGEPLAVALAAVAERLVKGGSFGEAFLLFEREGMALRRVRRLLLPPAPKQQSGVAGWTLLMTATMVTALVLRMPVLVIAAPAQQHRPQAERREAADQPLTDHPAVRPVNRGGNPAVGGLRPARTEVEPLEQRTGDSFPRVEAPSEAASSLSQFGMEAVYPPATEQDAIDALTEALRDSSPMVRAAATSSLTRLRAHASRSEPPGAKWGPENNK